MADDNQEGAMVELIPLDSPARQRHNPMRQSDWTHVEKVIDSHASLTRRKYAGGRAEHGGDCWAKPGMLAHALDEAADLPVYLWTLRDQIQQTANELRAGGITVDEAADALERMLRT